MSSVKLTDRTPEYLARFRKAQEDGLTAGANVIRNEVLRNLRGGYRTSLGNKGGFVTGNSLNHVQVAPVEWMGDVGKISVGTDLLYNLYWELGHHNIFTRHFERDEKWSPAFHASYPAAYQAFLRVMRSRLG